MGILTAKPYGLNILSSIFWIGQQLWALLGGWIGQRLKNANYSTPMICCLISSYKGSEICQSQLEGCPRWLGRVNKRKTDKIRKTCFLAQILFFWNTNYEPYTKFLTLQLNSVNSISSSFGQTTKILIIFFSLTNFYPLGIFWCCRQKLSARFKDLAK